MSDSPDSGAASPESTEDTANTANTKSTASAPDAADAVAPAVEPDAAVETDTGADVTAETADTDAATSTPAPIPVSHTTDLMRGIRQGAALSATAFACAAFLVHRYMEPAIPPPGKGGMVLLISQCLIGFVAWRIGRSRWEPTSRLMICVLTGTLGIGAVGALISWTFFSIRGSRTITGGLAACAVASLTIALTLDLLLCRRAGDAIPRPKGAEAWRSIPLGRRGRLGLLGAVAALLVPVLAAAALTLVPDPVTRTTAPAQSDDQLPATPASVSGQVAWQLAMDEPVVDIAAGKAGPVLITDNGLIGLNGDDGSTLWSYRRARGVVGRIGAPEPKARSRSSTSDEEPPVIRSVTSPDGSRIAIALAITPTMGSSIRVLTLVLDTVTGRVIMEHAGNRPRESASPKTPDKGGRAYDPDEITPTEADDIDEAMPAIQMTDSVVLIDTQAFSLADGSFMWELDLKQDSDKRYRFSGTAGHHTLITKKACENGHEDDPRPSACDLTLINDDDPDSEHLLMNVVGSPEDGLTVVDGWVVRYSDRDANASRADSGSRETAMEALDIDSLSGDVTKTVPEDARVVELEEFGGPDPWSSRSFIALRRAPKTEDLGQGRGLSIAALFDPSTGTLTPVAEGAQYQMSTHDHRPAGWATADTAVAVSAPSDSHDQPTGLALTRPDGSAAVTVESEALLHAGDSEMNQPQAIAAPGAVVMWSTFWDAWDSSGNDTSSKKATLIYGLR